MKTELINPFRPNRYEHADRPIIWLSPTAMDLERSGNVFIEGTRGSGKTSLLAALHWQERLENDSLQGQQDSRSSFRKFIAIYLKLPEFLTRAFSDYDWNRVFPSQPPGAVEEQAFQIFLQLGVVHQLVSAISTLVDRRIYATEKEKNTSLRSALGPLLMALEPIAGGARAADCSSTDDILAFVAAARDFFTLIHVRDLTSSDFRSIPFQLSNRLLAEAVRPLIAVLRGVGRKFHVKVCLDEAESLKPYQQLALNSLVRLSKAPVYFVLSFVSGGYEKVQTSLPNMSLSEADRRPHSIDEESDTTFLRSCEQVSAFRFWYAERDEEDADPQSTPDKSFFQIKEILGSTSINELVYQRLAQSLADEFPKTIIRTAEAIAGALSTPEYQVQPKGGPKDAFVEREGPFNILPLWQAYTLLRLNRLHHLKNATSSKARARLAATLRKKQRAALLLICSELGVRPPYSGWQVVLALSDKCIRDYLDIMGEIYEASTERGRSRPAEFRKRKAGIEPQRAGILRASRRKLEGIAQHALRHQRESFKLVACLGELQKRLQLGPTPVEPLRTPEIGVFRVRLQTGITSSLSTLGESTVSALSLVRDVLAECETHGYIKAVNIGGKEFSATPSISRLYDRPEITIRLHRRFAPFFNCSYRGPYHAVDIPVSEIAIVCASPDNVDPGQWATRVADRVRASIEGQSTFLE